MKKENPILIILAGGKSSRMGVPKGLLPSQDSYWLLKQIEAFQVEGDKTVVIGLGYDYKVYFKTIPWIEAATESPYNYQGKEIRVVLNSQPELGSFSTLQTVLKEVEKEKEILILPIDVPLFDNQSQELIKTIKNDVVIPNYQGKNGHPVKLSNCIWNSFLSIDLTSEEARLDVQIKKTNASKISIIEIDDASILKNLNTPESWQEYSNS